MEVTITESSNIITLAIQGDLDASSALDVDEALEEVIQKMPKGIKIDCKGLDYISSPGIGVFTSRIDDNRLKKVKVVFYDMNPKVFSVFEILGITQLLNIVNTENDAKDFINDV